MTDYLQLAADSLLSPHALDTSRLEKLLGRMSGPDIDYADVYLQDCRSEGWTIENGLVRSGSYSVESGAGLRAVSGEKTGFAYCDGFGFDDLADAADNARSISGLMGSGLTAPLAGRDVRRVYAAADPVSELDEKAKIRLLEVIDATARACDPRVRNVTATLRVMSELVLIAASDGTLVADYRPLVRLSVSVGAESNGRRTNGSAGGGGRMKLSDFIASGMAEAKAKEAANRALTNLEAVPAPAGIMDVVVGSGWPGVLLHEAVGHGLEGDFIRKQTSVFASREGTQVAAPGVNIVDNGTLPDKRGSLSVDDEGVETQCTPLIENGVLTGMMLDRMSARLMGRAPTGNGRRESYRHLPMPRMTNTYMLAGESSPEEIISSVKNGIYAVYFSGGQVDTTSGKFVFSANEAYLIEDGKITAPISGATLTGAGEEVLTHVSMIGNDLALDSGTALCGKSGQSVPVGVGQPTLRVDSMIVGGTKA
ncbi:MAG: metalloprotease TldD [Sphingobium sp.]|nr:metalloprotease TldD [Sphingobium sp.]